MSIHEKILTHNLFKDKEVDVLPTLPHVEPEPYMLAGEVKWRNKKLESNQQVSTKEMHEICEAISDGRIKIDTPADLANLLCIPTGQLLYITYHKTNTYKKFPIKKEMEMTG